MNIIIDTHIFLWALAHPDKISKAKRTELEDLSNTIYVSSISIAEIAIKASIGKLRIEFDPVAMARESGFLLLDFDSQSAFLLKDLPFHHRDPFDRMLIAQSMTTRFPIMTEDPKITLYDCQVI